MHLLKFSLFFFILSSCGKDPTRVDIAIKVVNQSNSKVVEEAVVYVKDGTTSDPGIPYKSYDRMFGTDAIGEANLNLPFNDYYLVAIGYSSSLKKRVTGTIAIHLNKNNQSIPQRIIVHTN